MNNPIFTPDYWNDRYNKKNDIWTLNNCNPVLVQVLEEKLISAPGKILVAGSGMGDDAVFLAKRGLSVTAADFSEEAVKSTQLLAEKEAVSLSLRKMDLFDLNKECKEEFDFLYEYVTICAVDKERIEELIMNFAAALKPGGLFVTVLFPVDGRAGGPPFAIDLERFYYAASKHLKLEYLCKNIDSIKPRKGNEILITFRKEQ
jgi:methyl halide transferase